MQLTKFLILIVIMLILSAGINESKTESVDLDQNSLPKIQVEKNDLQLNKHKGMMIYNGIPFSGYSVIYHSNNQLVEKVEYQNGKRNGVMLKWYPNGLLSYKANYIDNRLNGTSKSWWPNEQLRSESNYKNGVSDGIQKQWYRSGAPFKEIQLASGIEEGLQQAWRENGKLYINYEAKNGRIFGLKRSTLCYELEAETIQFK